MTDTNIAPEAIEQRVALGPLNRWWPVAASWMVTDKPQGLTRLGEKIAVWRDKDGAVHCIEDRCPHRGARLSMGWNLGDRIASLVSWRGNWRRRRREIGRPCLSA